MKTDLIYEFFANFRRTFIGINNSFDFRARLFACMLGVIKDDRQDIKRYLENLVNDIYKKDFKKKLFLATTRQYIQLIKQENVDLILKSIKKISKQNPKLKRKINFVQLDKLVLKKCVREGEFEVEDYSQIRVLEFLKNEVI